MSGVPVAAARIAPPGLRCSPLPITTKRNRNKHAINAACLIFVGTMPPPWRDVPCCFERTFHLELAKASEISLSAISGLIESFGFEGARGSGLRK